MRKLARSSFFGFFATGAVLVVSAASAADAGTDGGWPEGGTPEAGSPDAGAPVVNCDPTTLLCSNGMMPSGHKAESMDRLPTGVDTGWIPKCDPTATPQPHCDKTVQVDAQIAFDPPKTGGAVYSVDMSKDTFVDLRWDPADTSMFTVGLAGGKKSAPAGTFKVQHTLTPELALYIDASPMYTGEFKFDASTLINYIPGAQFNYYATGTQKFAPWGFDLVKNTVKGTDVANSTLFSITFDELGKLVGAGGFSDYISGSFGLNASTNSEFTYQTTKVVVSGATGPIGYAAGTSQYPIQDGDAVDMQVHAEGVIRYKGTIDLKVNIGITSVAGFGITLNFPIDVYSYPYDSSSIQVSFPTQQVHIPIPNVFVPSTAVNFGTVATGAKSPDKIVTIENTGELGALLEFSSDNSQFKVDKVTATMGPSGETYELRVRFQPTKAGIQKGVITVKSNDPDSPIQTLDVSGNGEGPDIPTPEDDAGTPGADAQPANQDQAYASSGDAGGCGCRTAPSGYGDAAAALALAGLGLAVLRRKRS